MIYYVLEPGIKEGSLSRIYDILMIIVIILCTVPLMVRETNAVFDVFDAIAVIVLPASVITAGYLEKLRIMNEEKESKKEKSED